MSLKIKLISCIVAFCMILSLLVVGVFAIKSTSLNVGGSIAFTAKGINATITEGSLNGERRVDLMPDLEFSTKANTTNLDVPDGWGSLGDNLKFESEGSVVKPVTISFKIKNTGEDMLYILTETEKGEGANKKFTIKTSTSDGPATAGAPAALNLKKEESVKFTITLTWPEVLTSLESTKFKVKVGLYMDITLPEDIGLLESNTHNNIKYTVNTDHTLALTDGKSCTGPLVIPRTLKVVENGLTYVCAVTSIGDRAFYDCRTLTGTVDFTNITSVGSNAFYFCRELTGDLDLSNVTNLGSSAFYACDKLGSDLILSPQLQTIPGQAFYWCKGITSDLDLSNVTNIGERAFKDCTGIKGPLILSPKLETIQSEAFNDCSSLSGTLDLINVKSIESSAFSGCYALSGDLDLSNVTNLGEKAFSSCSSFDGKLILSSNLKTIPNSAFAGCLRLTGTLNLANVTSIESSAFSSCSGFTGNLNLSKVTNLGDLAFNMCTGFDGKLSLSPELTSIPDFAFQTCSGLKGELNLSNVTSIGVCSFSGCTGISSVRLSTKIASMGQQAFSACMGLSELKIEKADVVTQNPTIGANAFLNVASNFAIKVPNDLVGMYQSAWADYTGKIVGIN